MAITASIVLTSDSAGLHQIDKYASVVGDTVTIFAKYYAKDGETSVIGDMTLQGPVTTATKYSVVETQVSTGDGYIVKSYAVTLYSNPTAQSYLLQFSISQDGASYASKAFRLDYVTEAHPIWQDLSRNFTGTYTIERQDSLGSYTKVMDGRSIGDSPCFVNRIVDSWLSSVTPVFEAEGSANNNLESTVYVYSGTISGVSYDRAPISFVRDYSYATINYSERTGVWLNRPIASRDGSMKAAEGMFIFWSGWSVGNNTITYGSETDTFANLRNHLTHYTIGFGDEDMTISCGGRSQSWKVSCGSYALYYRNAIGGFDSFLVEGATRRAADVERTDIVRNARRRSTAFGAMTVQTKLTETWEFNTGYLSDLQAETIATNLLTSLEVYVHNLENDIITPIQLTASTIERKQFAIGRTMINYVITANSSQYKIAR